MEAQDCFAFLYNITEVLKDGLTPFEKRWNHKFKGPIIPFGAEVEYRPSHPKGIERTQIHGKKVLSGIFCGYAQNAGGSWTGDLLIADWHEIEEADRPQDVHVHRVKSKEVTPQLLAGRHRFPLVTGDLRQPDSTLNRLQDASRPIKWKDRQKRQPHRPSNAGGNHCDEAPGNRSDEAEANHRQQAKDDHCDDTTQENDFWLKPFDPIAEQSNEDADFWSISGDALVRFIMVPRTEMFFPTEENMSFPLKYIV